MATGVYGTMFESEQTKIQRRTFRARHDGKGASNNSARLFPDSPIVAGVAGGASNRGDLEPFNDTESLRVSFASVVDSDSVIGGFGFTGAESVNLNYGAEGRPRIDGNGIVQGEPEAPVGAPSLLTPNINSPTDSEFVEEMVVPERKGNGFGIRVGQDEIPADGSPSDKIGKYFSNISGVD